MSSSRVLDFGSDPTTLDLSAASLNESSTDPDPIDTSIASLDSSLKSSPRRHNHTVSYSDDTTLEDGHGIRRDSKDSRGSRSSVLNNSDHHLSRTRTTFTKAVLNRPATDVTELSSCGFDHRPKWCKSKLKKAGGRVERRKSSLLHRKLPFPTYVALFLTAVMALLLTAILVSIPLGRPNFDTPSKLLWILFLNPLAYAILAVVIVILFFAVLNESDVSEAVP